MSSGLGRAATLSSIIGIAQRFLQIGVTLLITPIVIGVLGKNLFGIWAAAASLTWIAGAVDIGVGYALVTDISRALAANEKENARRLLTGALWLGAVIAVAEIVACVIFIPRFAPIGTSDAYLVAAVCMALNIPFNFSTALWAGTQRFYVVSLWEGAQSLLTACAMLMLSATTHDVRFYVAASVGCVLAANCASLCHFLIAHPELRPFSERPSLVIVRQLISRGTPYLILGLGDFLASYSDNIIALAALGADAAGVIAISQRVCMTAWGLLLALTQPLWPMFANAAARKEISWIKWYIWPAGLLVSLAAILGSALLILFGGKAIEFWLGGKIVIGPEILWAMAIWIIVPAFGRIADILLNALGIVWFQVKVAIVYGILAFGLKISLANAWGAPGILAATGIAYGLTHLPANLWWVTKWIRQAT